MSTPTQHAAEQAIAHDLDLCDVGMALTKGKRRQGYAKHRADCFKAIKEMNKRDGLDTISDDELLASLKED